MIKEVQKHKNAFSRILAEFNKYKGKNVSQFSLETRFKTAKEKDFRYSTTRFQVNVVADSFFLEEAGNGRIYICMKPKYTISAMVPENAGYSYGSGILDCAFVYMAQVFRRDKDHWMFDSEASDYWCNESNTTYEVVHANPDTEIYKMKSYKRLKEMYDELASATITMRLRDKVHVKLASRDAFPVAIYNPSTGDINYASSNYNSGLMSTGYRTDTSLENFVSSAKHYVESTMKRTPFYAWGMIEVKAPSFDNEVVKHYIERNYD